MYNYTKREIDRLVFKILYLWNKNGLLSKSPLLDWLTALIYIFFPFLVFAAGLVLFGRGLLDACTERLKKSLEKPEAS
jgi:hypothetical protein